MKQMSGLTRAWVMRCVAIVAIAVATTAVNADPAEPGKPVETGEEQQPADSAPAIQPPIIITPTKPPAPPIPRARTSSPKDFVVVPSFDGKAIHVAGKITSGITTAFKDALKKNPSVKTVVLSSNGGMLVEGLALANVIRKHGLNTHAEFICASACTFAYLAGQERSVAASAAIGFHQSSKPILQLFSGDTAQKYVAGNDVMRSVYADAGLQTPFIDAALKTPPNDMWFPDITELLSKNVAKRPSVAGEFPVTAGDWKSGSAIEAELARDPIFKAARLSKPRHYRIAVSDAWIDAAVNGNKNDAKEVARSVLVRQLLIDADLYDDALLDKYITLEHEIWGSEDTGANSKCEASLGIGFPVSSSEGDQLARQNAILLEMIQRPVLRADPTPERMNAAEATVIEFWGQMISEAPFNGTDVGRSFCREPGNYYDVLVTLPVDERVATFRGLTLINLRQSGLFRMPGL